MKIGPALKDGREANHLTQEIVSEKLFVTRQTISNWETNRSYPDLDRLVQLCDLYHLSLDDILRGDSDIMEHFKEQEKISNRTKLIIQVSYWLNIALLFWAIPSRFFGMPVRALSTMTLLLNLIYLLSSGGISELKKFSTIDKAILAIVCILIVGVVGARSFMGVRTGSFSGSYVSGEIVGMAMRMLVITVAILAIWFLRKYAFRK
ncbi:helix-turn-helix transcriptional regulator [Pediococcus argentinicus]|uniref:helix-turn-helix domain-containing protein n=1 Tax=Pediococcus argentinicus TaxID=480391 RepID=UPI00338E5557